MEAILNPWGMLYLHEHVYLVQLPTILALEWVMLTSALFLYVMLVMSVRVESRSITISRSSSI
jgi:hypothetical protein